MSPHTSATPRPTATQETTPTVEPTPTPRAHADRAAAGNDRRTDRGRHHRHRRGSACPAFPDAISVSCDLETLDAYFNLELQFQSDGSAVEQYQLLAQASARDARDFMVTSLRAALVRDPGDEIWAWASDKPATEVSERDFGAVSATMHGGATNPILDVYAD